MLLDQLQADLKNAQLAREVAKVSTLRLLLSEAKNKEIAKGGALTDEDIIVLISREVKKRKEAVDSFRAGAREELAAKEEQEAKILEAYLPEQMSSEELTKVVDETINEVGASSIADLGKVIGMVMGKVKGQADGSVVSTLVKEKLSHG